MKTTLTILRDLKDEDKLPPQAKIIVETITGKVGVNKPIERQTLIDQLKADGKLETRQDMARIVSFYQPKLEQLGLLAIGKEKEEGDDETADGKGKAKADKAPKEKTPKKAETATA